MSTEQTMDQANLQHCHCSRRCGGPNGVGRKLALRTQQEHARTDTIIHSANFREFVASSAGEPALQPKRIRTASDTGAGELSKRTCSNARALGVSQVGEGSGVSSGGSEMRNRDEGGHPEPNDGPADPDRNRALYINEQEQRHNFPEMPEIPDGDPNAQHDYPGDHGDPRDDEDDHPGNPRRDEEGRPGNPDHDGDDHGMQLPRRGQDPDDDDDDEIPELDFISVIDEISIANKFIKCVRNARLEDQLSDDEVERLRNPPQSVLVLEDKDQEHSIKSFLANTTASEEVYTRNRAANLERFPDCNQLTYHAVKELVADLTGIRAIKHDMCINSCVGYTGPFSELDCCPCCAEPRCDERGKPRKQFSTIPIGPQLQALWRSPEGVERLQYRKCYTEKITAELSNNGGTRISPFADFFDGSDYLNAVRAKKIMPNDMVLVFSIDGAQLYRNKASDCWIYIWVVMDLSPSIRYKKMYILPGGFIGGPGKPKYYDSFLLPGLSHVSAIQKEGLKCWNASTDEVFVTRPFLAGVGADSLGLAPIAGAVGHHGKSGCRVYCPFKGRHKPGGTHYYCARMKPTGFTMQGCDHNDVDLNTLLGSHNTKDSKVRYDHNLDHLMRAPNKTQYEKRRLDTGLCKPSIFSGLPTKHSMGVPALFVLDIMHLPALNIPDLIIPLWRGTFECDKTDDKSNWTWAVLKDPVVWKAHGQSVADATEYIPGSFDRPPRNPAEKINSGYKAWEFLLYFFGLGPALLFGILPEPIWRNYCKCVRAFRILMQEEITPAELLESHTLMTEFSNEFEELYVQRQTDQIHFVRPCIHTASHFGPKTVRIGPGLYSGQWPMERTIGNLGEEVKCHKDPYANLSERGVRRCRVNALKALMPNLEPAENPLPRGSENLGDEFVLLRARDRYNYLVECPFQSAAIQKYLEDEGVVIPDNWEARVCRWARVRLPNSQVARSLWKEGVIPLGEGKLCTAQNLKVNIDGKSYLAEAHYYMMLQVGNSIKSVAMLSFYGPPHEGLYQASSKTYWTVKHLRTTSMHVVDIKSIQSVVCLAPDRQYGKFFQDGTEDDRWYLSEKPGLKISQAVGLEELLEEE